MLEEREKIEENIKKCQSLIAKQVEINNTFNQLVDAQDKTEGKVPLCPVQPKIIQQQSAIAQYLQNKLQLFDVKIKPIKDKYEFLEFLLSDLPLENFRPAHSTISVYF